MSPDAGAPAGAAPSKRARMVKRTLVGLLLAAAVAGMLALSARSEHGWIVLGVGTLLSGLCLLELASMERLRGAASAACLGPALAWVTLHLADAARGVERVWTAWGPGPVVELAGAAALAALLALLGQALPRAWPRPRVGLTVGLALLVTVPLPWLWRVWNLYGTRGLVALLVLAKVGDIAGYYVGSAIGKRRPFPRISPGKTVAGCWGSFAAGTAAGAVLVALGVLEDPRWGLASGLLAGAAVNLASQAGDLLESWIKRRAGVKDSGTWFGPSGGVLDLVDSLLLAIPVALLTWPLLLGP